MDKYKGKSELYIHTKIELQIEFKMATQKLASKNPEDIKSAHAALKDIKSILRTRGPQM